MTKEICGCEVLPYQERVSGPPPSRILRCLLHQAAPDLADALERFLDCRTMRIDLFQEKYPDAPLPHIGEKFESWLADPARAALAGAGRKGHDT